MAYCTNTEVKNYLGISDSSDDALITTLIAAAQAQIDKHCRRSFEASQDSTRYFNADEDVTDFDLWLDKDLCAITTVTNGDGSTVSSSKYTTIPRNEIPYYRLRLLGSSGLAWTYTSDPDDAISIAGKWAYSTSAPADIKQACIRLAAFMYRQKDKSMFDVQVLDAGSQYVTPLAIPNDVKEILADYRRLM